MNNAEKDLAVQVGKKMLLMFGLKWAIIFAVTRGLRKAAS